VYGRSNAGQELNFEASGALESASLVMRDRETDSWWSLMSSKAIGGELDGSRMEEMAGSEKAQWLDWVSRHPDTLVLSVEGVEHVENNPYDNYFGDGEHTFRDIKVEDNRLGPKQPIYAFWWEDRPVAVSHEFVEGGVILPLPGSTEVAVLWREKGVSVFASSRVRIVEGGLARKAGDAAAVFAALDAGELGDARSAAGFDTYWYTWVLVNPATEILAP
jgi:hypothetical protein